jgi:hypothetical protein
MGNGGHLDISHFKLDFFVHETARTAVHLGAWGVDERIILELIRE